MINKAFVKLFGNKKNVVEELNINLESRPSELDFKTYYHITEFYEKLFRN